MAEPKNPLQPQLDLVRGSLAKIAQSTMEMETARNAIAAALGVEPGESLIAVVEARMEELRTLRAQAGSQASSGFVV